MSSSDSENSDNMDSEQGSDSCEEKSIETRDILSFKSYQISNKIEPKRICNDPALHFHENKEQMMGACKDTCIDYPCSAALHMDRKTSSTFSNNGPQVNAEDISTCTGTDSSSCCSGSGRTSSEYFYSFEQQHDKNSTNGNSSSYKDGVLEETNNIAGAQHSFRIYGRNYKNERHTSHCKLDAENNIHSQQEVRLQKLKPVNDTSQTQSYQDALNSTCRVCSSMNPRKYWRYVYDSRRSTQTSKYPSFV